MNIIHPELTTIRDFIRFATSEFNAAKLYFGHGTDNAWDDAIALILHTLYLPSEINPTILDAHITTEERQRIFEVINKRCEQRIPVPYITKEAWFAGLPFYVDERVLIPRSPIGELIAKRFAPWIDDSNIHTILDLCTGSGCIAIACAQAFPEAMVDAIEISEDALAVASINIQKHDLEDQVNLIKSDLFANVENKKYDIIVSNPPYVCNTEMDELPKEYQYEPNLALRAGNEGLDIVNQILAQARKFLTTEGVLIVEVGNSEYALTEAYPQLPFTWLEFEHGGGGVFLLTAQDLKNI